MMREKDMKLITIIMKVMKAINITKSVVDLFLS